MRTIKYLSDPVFMRRLHGVAAIAWLVAAIPICIFLKDSLPLLVFISVYAIVTGHWSSWQTGNVEVKQYQDADVSEVLEEVKKIS